MKTERPNEIKILKDAYSLSHSAVCSGAKQNMMNSHGQKLLNNTTRGVHFLLGVSMYLWLKVTRYKWFWLLTLYLISSCNISRIFRPVSQICFIYDTRVANFLFTTPQHIRGTRPGSSRGCHGCIKVVQGYHSSYTMYLKRSRTNRGHIWHWHSPAPSQYSGRCRN